MTHILITGASAGIGTEFARQLAAKGNDLVLVARRKDRLDALATELTGLYGIDVRTMAVDCADQAAIQLMAKDLELAGIRLHGLVNNAGYGVPGDFMDGNLDQQLGMIRLNVVGLMAVTHCLVPLFADEGERFIINVASVAAFMTIPGFAVYAASKAAVLSFSDALVAELADKGITVSCLCPGPTESEFVDANHFPDRVKERTSFMPTDVVVRESLEKINKPVVISGIQNRLQNRLLHIMPRGLARSAANKIRMKLKKHL